MPERDEVELQPDVEEVLQAEMVEEPAVKVRLTGSDGPIRTQELPHKQGGTRTWSSVPTLTVAPATRILRADHRRAVARIVSVGQAFFFALSEAAAQDTQTMAVWPAGLVLTVTCDSGVWVASQTGTTNISVMTEFWATGG